MGGPVLAVFLVRKEQMRTKQEEKKVREERKKHTYFASKAAMGPVKGGAQRPVFRVYGSEN
jgi:hypothetical protein